MGDVSDQTVYFATVRHPDGEHRMTGLRVFGTEPSWDAVGATSTDHVPVHTGFRVVRCSSTRGLNASSSEWSLATSEAVGEDCRLTGAHSPEHGQRSIDMLVRGLLKQSDGGDVLVYVHGFNNSFDESIQRAARMSAFLGEYYREAGKGRLQLLVFSSASHESFLQFDGDTMRAPNASMQLAKLIQALSRACGHRRHRHSGRRAVRVHLLAHSLGAHVLGNALINLDRRAGGDADAIGEIILAAPELPLKDFYAQAGAFTHCAGRDHRVTLYFNPGDAALGLAATKKGSFLATVIKAVMKLAVPPMLWTIFAAYMENETITSMWRHVVVALPVLQSVRMVYLGESLFIRPEPRLGLWPVQLDRVESIRTESESALSTGHADFEESRTLRDIGVLLSTGAGAKARANRGVLRWVLQFEHGSPPDVGHFVGSTNSGHYEIAARTKGERVLFFFRRQGRRLLAIVRSTFTVAVGVVVGLAPIAILAVIGDD